MHRGVKDKRERGHRRGGLKNVTTRGWQLGSRTFDERAVARSGWVVDEALEDEGAAPNKARPASASGTRDGL